VVETKFRLKHLMHVMHLAMQYELVAVLRFHEAVLLEIERGLLRCEESFTHLEMCKEPNSLWPFSFIKSVDTARVILSRLSAR